MNAKKQKAISDYSRITNFLGADVNKKECAYVIVDGGRTYTLSRQSQMNSEFAINNDISQNYEIYRMLHSCKQALLVAPSWVL